MSSKKALIAGSGHIVVKSIKLLKPDIVISLVKDPSYKADYIFSPWQVKSIINTLKQENISSVVFIGKIEKREAFKNFKFDIEALKILSTLKNFSDDEIMNKVIEVLNKNNIKVISQKEAFKDFLAKKDSFDFKLSSKEREDVRYGFSIAKKIGELGIGQTVCVKNGSTIAVEAIEGTDETIKRAGRYVKDFIVVKVKRPNQSDLMDLPTVGVETLKVMKEAQAKVLAIEENECIISDEDFKEKAKELGIKVTVI